VSLKRKDQFRAAIEETRNTVAALEEEYIMYDDIDEVLLLHEQLVKHVSLDLSYIIAANDGS